MRRLSLVLVLLLLCLTPRAAQAQGRAYRFRGKTIQEWLGETKGGSKASRMSAVVALGQVGVKATDALIVVTTREDPDVRQLAVTFLGVLRGQDSKTVPALCRCLSDKKQSVREAAEESLFNRGEEAKGVLHKNAQSKEKALRYDAYLGLVALGFQDSKSVTLIIKGLGDSESSIVDLSIAAVSKFGPKAKGAIPRLAKILEGTMLEKRRQRCFLALSKIGREAIPVFEKLAKSEVAEIAQEAQKRLRLLRVKARLY